MCMQIGNRLVTGQLFTQQHYSFQNTVKLDHWLVNQRLFAVNLGMLGVQCVLKKLCWTKEVVGLKNDYVEKMNS